MKKKVRIIKRTSVGGIVEYIIQRKGWLGWRDAWFFKSCGSSLPLWGCCKDNFYTLEEAQKNLCYFDGSKPIEEIINV